MQRVYTRCPEPRRVTGDCHAAALGWTRVKSCLTLGFIVPFTAKSVVYSPLSLSPLPLSHVLTSFNRTCSPPHASTSLSRSELPLAPSHVCVLDSAFLDGSETPRIGFQVHLTLRWVRCLSFSCVISTKASLKGSRCGKSGAESGTFLIRGCVSLL